MLRFKLIHVSKRGHWCQSSWQPLRHMTVEPHKQLFTWDRRVFSQMMIPWVSLLTILPKPAFPHCRGFDRCQLLKRVVAMNQCHLAQPGAPVFFFWNSPLITPVQLAPSGRVVGINYLFVCWQVPIRLSVMSVLTSFSPPIQESELSQGTSPTPGRTFANAGQSAFGKLHLKSLC